MGERVVQSVQIWTLACANPDCSLVGVEVEAPSKIAISGHLATRPAYVCLGCEFDLMRLPDKPHVLKMTTEQRDLVIEALALARDLAAADEAPQIAYLLTVLVDC